MGIVCFMEKVNDMNEISEINEANERAMLTACRWDLFVFRASVWG